MNRLLHSGIRLALVTLGLVLALPTFVSAQTAISAGSLVLLRVGDGTNTISGNAAAISLIEVSTATGNVIQTINVSTTGANASTARGNSTTSHHLALSADGSMITFGGYRADQGTSDPSAAAVDRVISKLMINTGVVNTAQALTNLNVGNDFRAVASNGTSFWTVGENATTGGGLNYIANGSATTATGLGTVNNNLRSVQVIGNNLYTASGSATPGRGVQVVGDGLPTSGDPAFTQTLDPSNAAGGANNANGGYTSFFFARLGSGTTFSDTGFDTLYVLSNGGTSGLEKFSFNGTNWVFNNRVTLSSGHSITGVINGSSVDIYATVTTGGVSNPLRRLTDTSGFNANNNGTFADFGNLTGVTGANLAFRGIAFVPVPEPTTVLAICAAGAGLVGVVRRRRNKNETPATV